MPERSCQDGMMTLPPSEHSSADRTILSPSLQNSINVARRSMNTVQHSSIDMSAHSAERSRKQARVRRRHPGLKPRPPNMLACRRSNESKQKSRKTRVCRSFSRLAWMPRESLGHSGRRSTGFCLPEMQHLLADLRDSIGHHRQ